MEFQNNTRCGTTYCVWTYRWRWYSKLWRRRKWHSKWKFSDPESLRRKSSSICGLYLLKRLSTTVAGNNHWSTYWPSAFSNQGMYSMSLIVHYITPTISVINEKQKDHTVIYSYIDLGLERWYGKLTNVCCSMNNSGVCDLLCIVKLCCFVPYTSGVGI